MHACAYTEQPIQEKSENEGPWRFYSIDDCSGPAIDGGIAPFRGLGILRFFLFFFLKQWQHCQRRKPLHLL